ncbi:MAG: DAK2 domain-containing protein [Ruminococcaceae bacterium]|nr:DAK2 domain-containing protein [Oscillospiraceae bacterium]
MEYKTISGVEFAGMIVAAAAMIEKNKNGLNELNVFPVPDGDTGTNMAMTIMAAADLFAAAPVETSLTDVAGKAASALLRGARGNSGVIMSLLFRGMSKSMKGKKEATSKEFAAAMKAGVEAAYGAVMKPAEGTVLTVSRKAAEKAMEVCETEEDILALIVEAKKAADEALALTPTQNPVLAKAGVVDAGGQGYCYILDGFIASLQGEKIEFTASAETTSAFEKFDTEDIQFAYCTEFLINKAEAEKSVLPLRAYLESIGDCVVVVDDEEIVKVHVHSNNPGKVLEEALTYGSLSKIKIENMKEQHTEKLVETGMAEEIPAAPAEEVLTEDFGFVSVAAGEGIAEVFRDLGVSNLVEGGQTMNPSTADILAEIEKVHARTVFVLPNNKNIELAARQTVSLVENKRVVVLGTHSIPQGISAMLVFEPTASADENIDAMKEAIGAVRSGSITYAARNSVFEGNEILEGDILALSENKVCAIAKNIPDAVDSMLNATGSGENGIITIFYGEDVTEADAEAVQAQTQEKFPDAEVSLVYGGQPIYYYLVSVE